MSATSTSSAAWPEDPHGYTADRISAVGRTSLRSDLPVDDSPLGSDHSDGSGSAFSSRYDQLHQLSAETFNTDFDSSVDQLAIMEGDDGGMQVATQDLHQEGRFSPPPPPPPGSVPTQPTHQANLFSLADFLAHVPAAPPVQARVTPVTDPTEDLRISDLTFEVDRYAPAPSEAAEYEDELFKDLQEDQTQETMNPRYGEGGHRAPEATQKPDFEPQFTVVEDPEAAYAAQQGLAQQVGTQVPPVHQSGTERPAAPNEESSYLDDATLDSAVLHARFGAEAPEPQATMVTQSYHMTAQVPGHTAAVPRHVADHDGEFTHANQTSADSSVRAPTVETLYARLQSPGHVSMVDLLPQRAASPVGSDGEESPAVSIQLSPLKSERAFSTFSTETAPERQYAPLTAPDATPRAGPHSNTAYAALSPRAPLASHIAAFERDSPPTTPFSRHHVNSNFSAVPLSTALTALSTTPQHRGLQEAVTQQSLETFPRLGEAPSVPQLPEGDSSHAGLSVLSGTQQAAPTPIRAANSTPALKGSSTKARPVYDLHIASELDAWAQYKASLLLQTQLIDKVRSLLMICEGPRALLSCRVSPLSEAVVCCVKCFLFCVSLFASHEQLYGIRVQFPCLPVSHSGACRSPSPRQCWDKREYPKKTVCVKP
jgi:hypothetical protein